ncbi:WSC domain-containing protein [Thelonectria olida]|uniref:WSC domain-containing protein n=1 Tax=Thelonectria olida TaxID=1576542 RepID=A0A9P8WFZ9_9HYPO|nr:WSC domain-containing protein [Thelonectria olida]
MLRPPYIIAFLAFLTPLLASQHPRDDVKAVLYEPPSRYVYYGCYNETTQVHDTSGARALDGGTHLVRKGYMTVPMCLEFCSSNGTQYTYAGLEWSRECWCADNIAAVSDKLDDSQCSYACEGNSSQICGGSLKLTVYTFSSAPLGPQISVVLLVATAMAVLMF